jgi:hypothetical protein
MTSQADDAGKEFWRSLCGRGMVRDIFSDITIAMLMAKLNFDAAPILLLPPD